MLDHTACSPRLLSVCLFVFLCPGLLFVDISVSLLAVVVTFCGLALLVVSLFVFWKLCWPVWRNKALTSHADNAPQSVPGPPPEATQQEDKKAPEVTVNGRNSEHLQEAAMKISQTSPDIPAEVQTALKEHLIKHAKVQRQTTEPTSSSRYCLCCG